MVRYAKTAPPRVDLTRQRSAEPSAPRQQPYEVRARLGPAAIAQLVAEYEDGEHTTDLATRYRVGKGTVIQILHDHDVQMRRQGFVATDLPAAAERYLAGGSLVEVAAEFGLDIPRPSPLGLARPGLRRSLKSAKSIGYVFGK